MNFSVNLQEYFVNDMNVYLLPIPSLYLFFPFLLDPVQLTLVLGLKRFLQKKRKNQ